MPKGLKNCSSGVVFALALVLVLVMLGGMFFSDDLGSIFVSNPTTTQAMELQGKWLGMDLAALNSATARRWGVPPSTEGVLVVEIGERTGLRALQAGVISGDIIAAVNGQSVNDLADLYNISTNLDVGSAVTLDMLRWGQPVQLTMPAAYAAAPAQLPPGIQPVPQPIAQGANVAALQPVAINRGLNFYCPKHNQMWPQRAVFPNYSCPLCNGPLSVASSAAVQ